MQIDLGALTRSQADRAKKYHPLVRWFEQFAIVRITSAHHARLWNRSYAPVGTAAMRTIPKMSSLPAGPSERIYGALCVMGLLLDAASLGTTWRNKIVDLVDQSFTQFHGRRVEAMGFPET